MIWKIVVQFCQNMGGGTKLDPIVPNQVKMTAETEKWAIWYRKGKDVTNENRPVSVYAWIM